MKATTPAPRASHVNVGTSIPQDELQWPDTAGRVLRLPKTDVEVDQRSEVTPYGGLALFAALVRRFGVAEKIDEGVSVFKIHRPFHESDHVLSIAANLFVGGSCLEDQANLQQSEAVRRILGAVRIPDPMAAGDFCGGLTSRTLPRSAEPTTTPRTTSAVLSGSDAASLPSRPSISMVTSNRFTGYRRRAPTSTTSGNGPTTHCS